MLTISTVANCGDAKTLASALYGEFPILKGQSQIISTSGKVCVKTRAEADAGSVKRFIANYAQRLAEAAKEEAFRHQGWMDDQHLRQRYASKAAARQRYVQSESRRLRMK